MTAAVVALTVVVAILGLLVAGLLRSHADILRALHDLGVRIDGSGAGPQQIRLTDRSERRTGDQPIVTRPGVPQPGPGAEGVADVAGQSPAGGSLVVGVSGAPHRTLLAFLTSGCLTCQHFWETFASPGATGLPDSIRLVVVTHGPDGESPAAVAELAPPDIPVVMSDLAWDDYRVPVAPYFVLVDGPTAQVLGEGASASWEQVRALMVEAVADQDQLTGLRRRGGSTGRRDADADDALLEAGIRPGDPRLRHER